MNAKQQTKISKRLSLILRHNPQSIGIQLDSSGWATMHQNHRSELGKAIP